MRNAQKTMDFAIIVAIVAGLTQVFKQFGFNERFTPVFALVAGIGITMLSGEGGVAQQALNGIVAGLTACGAYDVAVKTLANK